MTSTKSQQNSCCFQSKATMKHILILLLLFWDSVEFTLTLEECSQLPLAKHAFVPDEYKKVEYLKGDVIYFSCNPGYTTGFNTTYICTEQGWRASTYGQCFVKGTDPVRLGCAQAPALRHGYSLKNSTYFYPDGQKVRYECDHFYKLKGGPYKTCTNGQWIGDLQCVASFCERPQIDNGTPEEDKEKYAENEVLRYSCDRGYRKVASRPSLCLMVDWDAPQWSPSPQCEPSTCVLSQNPPAGTTHPVYQLIFRPGQSVTVSCGEKQWVKSRELQSAELTCQDTGLWDFQPVCQSQSCDVVLVSNSVVVFPANVRQLQKDQRLWFRCRERSHVLRGTTPVTCLKDGQWSHPFPSCADPRSCESPPSLDNGDFIGSANEFAHNAKVLYQCQKLYVMQGGPYKTCVDGVWTGEITCLKPCTVNSDLMVPNKIQIRYGDWNKLYVPHLEHLTFECVDGATHDGIMGMRQQCHDGQMALPRCV